MDKFDFEKKQATPEWLTSILAKNEFLSKGKVSSIEQEISKSIGFTITSTYFSLKVNYSKESSSLLPSKILMKMIKPEFYDAGQKEVDFYDAVVNTKTPLLPVMTCYGTEKSPKTKQCYILLDDLTHTHYQTKWPLPPAQDQCKEAITVLAKMHAYWWNHSRFEEPIFELPSEEGVRKSIQQAEKLFPKFVNFLGDRLSEKRKKTYDLVFEKLPELCWSRLSSPKRLTLIHRDAHYWNFLFPRNKEENQCVIIDWQSWGIGVGAVDLSKMIALRWYPERRQRMEQPLLKFYLEEMQKQHIDYVWNDFWTDYRVCVIVNLLNPVFLHSMLDLHPAIWWPNLERGFAAFEDLNCLEFL
ncbi:MAG: aminoglycoside phosphotransferase family protein [Planctomycetota bacterium]|jgi:hypothetical protein